MGGFASFIGGAGSGAASAMSGHLERRNKLQLEQMQLDQERQRQLMAQLEAIGRNNPGTHLQPDLEQMSAEVAGLPTGADLSSYGKKVGALQAQAREAYANAQAAKQAQAVVDKHTIQRPDIGGINPVQVAQGQIPFQQQLGPPPGSPPTAQPGTSLAQQPGGGSSPNATFRTPDAASVSAAPGAGAPAPLQSPADVQSASTNIHSDAAVPATPVAPVPPVGGAPQMQFPQLPDLDLSDQVKAFNMYGQTNPVSTAFIPKLAELATLPASERLKLELGLEGSRRTLSELDQQGVFKDMPPALRSIVQAGAYHIPIPGLAGLITPKSVPGLLSASELPPGTKDFYGNVIDPQATPYLRAQRNLLTGTVDYFPEQGGVSHVIKEDPESTITGYSNVIYDHSGNETGRVRNVPYSPAFGHVSELDIPGQAPQITKSQTLVPGMNAPTPTAPTQGQGAGANLIQRGGGAAAPATAAPAGVPPIVAPGRTNAAPAPAPLKPPAGQTKKLTAMESSVVNDPAVAANYDDWISGKATLNDAKEQAVRVYAHAKNLPTPEILSPAGEESVRNVMPILKEIMHARTLLYDEGLTDSSLSGRAMSKAKLAAAFAAYDKLHFSTPLTRTISDISFDRIRSVGQALQNSGSRALPIFNLGLEHTPIISLNPDDGYGMEDKLKGMQRRAVESLTTAQGMTKSGVIAPVGSVKTIPVVVERRSDGVRGLIDPMKFDPAKYRYIEEQQ